MKTYLGNDAPLPNNDCKPHAIDIVVHLGREGRFGGWGDKTWTVLHHSMLTSMLWMAAYGTRGMHYALLHDGHEYLLGDTPSPVKAFLGKVEVKSFEDMLDTRIRALLGGIPAPTENERAKVKCVDLAALIIEAYYFGTKETFEHIADVDWGINLAKTEEEQNHIRYIIGNLCPEVVEEMNRPKTMNDLLLKNSERHFHRLYA